MKKVKAIILGAVISCSLVCASGCGFEGTDTDDGIYAALAKATQEFAGYKGALTIEMDYLVEEGGEETENAKFIYSIDPEKKSMYCTMDAKKTDVTVKVFGGGENSYIMTSVSMQKESNGGTLTYEADEYYGLSEDSVRFLTSKQSFSSFSEQDIDSLFQDYLYTFTQTKEAYERVYAEQVEKAKPSDEDAYAEYSITTDKSFNSISLREYSKIQKSDWSKVNGYGVFTVEDTSNIVGKSGKIAQAEIVRAISFAKDFSDYKQTEKRTVRMDIEYSFDKKGYEAIQTELPEYLNAYPYSEDFTMQFNIGGMTKEATTTAYAYNPQFIFNNLSKGFNKGGCTIEWYADPAYTTPFVAQDMSYEEFKSVACVYGKVTVKEGYAIVANDYRVRDERSDDYKAVFGPIQEPSKDYEVLERKEAGESYFMTVLPDHENALNGEVYDENSNTVVLEEGKFYLITRTSVKKDEDYSIFDIDTSWLSAYGEGMID